MRTERAPELAPALAATGPRRDRLPATAVIVGLLAGSLVAAQSQVNGTLGGSLGSPVFAALLSASSGLAVLVVIGLLRGGGGRLRLLPVPAGARPWHYLGGGVSGAVAVTGATIATPIVGVTLVGVSLVAGQATGSLIADHFGLSPNGVRAVTPRRIAAGILAVAGLAVGGSGTRGNSATILLLVLAAAGAGMAIGFSANGHLQRMYGDASIAALINFATSTSLITALAVLGLATGLVPLPAPGGPIPIWEYTGGLLGMVWVVAGSLLVSRLGVLGLALAGVAGQLSGAVAIDAVVRYAGAPPLTRLVGVVLVGLAVVLAATGAARRSSANNLVVGGGRR